MTLWLWFVKEPVTGDIERRYWPNVDDEWAPRVSIRGVIVATCQTTLSACYTESKEQEVRSRYLPVVEQHQHLL